VVAILEQAFRDQWGRVLAATGRNRAIHRIRRDRTLAAKTRMLQVSEPSEDMVSPTTFPERVT